MMKYIQDLPLAVASCMYDIHGSEKVWRRRQFHMYMWVERIIWWEVESVKLKPVPT